MKIEKQVCSLELAKKLKSLNVKQESLYVYGSNLTPVEPHHYTLLSIEKKANYPNMFNHTTSAFTCAELGEMLPDRIKNLFISELDKKEKALSPYHFIELPTPQKSIKKWYGSIISCTNRLIKEVQADTEADARAKMLIWLIENKHLEVK